MTHITPLILNGHGHEQLATFLATILDRQHGVVGFAPGIIEDADDTARSLIVLQYLGAEHDPSSMVTNFQREDHFCTYANERNRSFSANCNVLLALLGVTEVRQYLPQIELVSQFLLRAWKTNKISDKWNLTPYYANMLLAEAFILMLDRYNRGDLPFASNVYQRHSVKSSVNHCTSSVRMDHGPVRSKLLPMLA